MRITIATGGRFHVLDLARELAALGHEVAFHTFVPRRRVERFGLPPECHRGHLAAILPWFVLQRYGRGRIRRWAGRRLRERLDRAIAGRLAPCEVFIGMSGLALESARAARERFGAKVLIERGSRHILSQKAILDALPGAPRGGRVPGDAVRRELASYELADLVVVPSRHVVESFVAYGFPRERLFRNPYGVDLEMFPPTPGPRGLRRTILFVGIWGFRKGSDLLMQALTRFQNADLLHVGPIDDVDLPVDARFRHVDPVPQWKLLDHYSEGDIFVLPSREEGLSLVQAQALACGLPVVCSNRTGGEDLREMLDDPRWITVVPHDDVEALVSGIRKALSLAATKGQGPRRILTDADRRRLSWSAYGRRYDRRLHDLLRTAEAPDGGGR